MKASPQIQLRLLELADLDAELARLDHRRRGLPEVDELAALEARVGELKDALVATETELGDLSREQTRAERDVEQVRTRIDRDRTRLDAGQVSAARELASLQSEIDEQAAKASDKRASVAADVPADLLALYDQIRKTKGVGAAMLRAGRCEGCHLSLNAADLNVIRASAPDEVVRCEECRRILVRAPESGL